MSQPRAPWAVIAGGGTGGHVYPGLAVARALVEGGRPASSIQFVGARRGMESTMVPEAGFSVTLLPGRGIARQMSFANLGALGGIAVAVMKAVFLLGRRRPAVVVSVGGYASVPCVAAAALLRIPLVVINVDAVPGLANRFAGRFAAAAAVAYAGTPLRNAVVTGVPVRDELNHVDRSEAGRSKAREALGIPADVRVVAVSGGSLGARRINSAVDALVELWAERADVAVRHVLGARDWDAMRRSTTSTRGLIYQPVRYEADMATLYAAADVAVQRAGASTVAELCAAGVPSILVPLPGSPGDHQGANARALAEAGATVVISDRDLDGERLSRELDLLLADPARLAAMGDSARRLARPDAARSVAALVEEHASV